MPRPGRRFQRRSESPYSGRHPRTFNRTLRAGDETRGFDRAIPRRCAWHLRQHAEQPYGFIARDAGTNAAAGAADRCPQGFPEEHEGPVLERHARTIGRRPGPVRAATLGGRCSLWIDTPDRRSGFTGLCAFDGERRVYSNEGHTGTFHIFSHDVFSVHGCS